MISLSRFVTSDDRRTSRRMKSGSIVAALGLLVAACGGADTSAPAPAPAPSEAPAVEEEAPEELFDLTSVTLEIVVQYSPGGGFDLQAREMARLISAEYGIRTVVINDTGAGGLVALNNHAAADPSAVRVLYIQTPAALSSQIGEAEGVRYDLRDFPFIARAVSDELLLVASTASGFTTLEEILNAPNPSFAATGPGGIDYLAGSVLDAIFDEMDLRLVSGYGGQPETTAGMLRGDAALTATATRAMVPLINDGEIAPIVIIGSQRSATLPDVPTLSEVAPAGGPDRAGVIAALEGLAEAGRTLATVPGTPEPVVNALRALFDDLLQRDDFKEYLISGGSIPGYTPGDVVGQQLADIINSGGQFEEVLRAAAS